MDRFVAWNLRLLEAFFSAASRDEEVWLALEPAELDAIGPDLGGDVGLLAAARAGAPWPSILRHGQFVPWDQAGFLTDRCLGLVEQRKRAFQRPARYVDPGELRAEYRGVSAPTYLPYLAAMVRCAAAQGDDGFYAELKRSLSLEDTWYSQEMSRLMPVWEDLQAWTSSVEGRFGRFVFRQLGGFRLVGVPRAQSIISRHDVEKLGQIFAGIDIDPDAPVTEDVVARAYEAAARSNLLSLPLRDALADPAFSGTLRARLRSLITDWDGPCRLDEHEIEVALTLGDGNALPWAVSWLVPPIRDEGEGRLRQGSSEWVVTFNGTQPVVTRGTASQEAARLLAESERTSVGFELLVRTTEGGPNEVEGRLLLKKGILRTLVAQSGQYHGQVVLVERSLPFHGCAYMLASPSNAARLEGLLKAHQVEYQSCPVDGLPEGWWLACLLDCESIPHHFRKVLPTGEGVSRQARALRLVGGRFLTRGGIRQYLPYDLPWLEVDAPRDVVLTSPGLALEEVITQAGGLGDLPIGQATSVRRYQIGVEHAAASAFTISAAGGGGRVGEVRLRIAPSGGLESATGEAFHLGRLGEPSRDAGGLSGVLRGTGAPSIESGDGRHRIGTLGIFARPDDAGRYRNRVAAQFLDTLSQVGSVGYGAARDQIRRISEKAGSALSPIQILLALRSRGLVEIETDLRGRMVRVHAVAPALCVPRHVGHVRGVVAFPIGTLRLAHWDLFCRVEEVGLKAYRDADLEVTVLPGLWLVGQQEAITRLASASNMPIIEGAAESVARWAGTLADFEDALTTRSVESMGHRLTQLQQFHADSGRFLPVEAPRPSRQCKYLMFRAEDAETQSHKIHTITYVDGSDNDRFSFVRDSRWGTWLALSAFARCVQDMIGDDEAWPWPLHRDDELTLWIPARLNVPLVLERALVLCSGDLPIVRRFFGHEDGGALRLRDASSQTDVGSVSRVYHGYIVDPLVPATWLGYRWVPPAVAAEVVRKLGATVLSLGR